MSFEIPKQLIEKYKLAEQIGTGRNGVVYKIINIINDRAYALKMVKSDVEDIKKACDDLRKEVQFLKKADHKLLPQVFESLCNDDSQPWFVTSYHPGCTFEDFRKKNLTLNTNEAMFVILSLIDVLEYIHEVRGVHCDLHTKNVMISENVFQHGIMVIDFGSGHIWSDNSPFTREGGDFRFKPPNTQADHRKFVERKGRKDQWRQSDLSALGHLLGTMHKVFMSNATDVQKEHYFRLCEDLRSDILLSWDDIKEQVKSVFHPYYAIESNADLLGHSEENCRWVCLPVTGHVSLESSISKLVETDEIQNLQQLKQLSFCEWAYPGAHHTRYEHSLGVFQVMQRLLSTLGRTSIFRKYYCADDVKSALVAALVHDIGHYPFAHPIEQFASCRFPNNLNVKKSVSHSQRSIDMLDKEDNFGKKCRAIFGDDIIDYSQKILEGGAGALSSILIGAVDIDKIDYLRRDSYHCGLTYGLGNSLDHLVQCFRIHPEGNLITIIEDGVSAVEGFILLQDQMLTDVYWQELPRSVFVQLHTILVILSWSGEKEILDEKRFLALVEKLKNEKSEMDAIEMLIKEHNQDYPKSWQKRYPRHWNELRERGISILKSIKHPHDAERYRCIDEFRISDNIPKEVKSARYPVWHLIYPNQQFTTTIEAVNWQRVTQLRASYKQAISKHSNLNSWSLLEVLVDVPFDKTSNKEIQLQKRNGELTSLSNVTHLQESIFTNPTRYSSIVRVFVSSKVYSEIEESLDEVRATALKVFYSDKVPDEF